MQAYLAPCEYVFKVLRTANIQLLSKMPKNILVIFFYFIPVFIFFNEFGKIITKFDDFFF